MSLRKPPGESWETFVDRQIREARERGDFDDLPGAGKPIPDLDRPYDDLWWIRKKLEEENLSYLPPTLQVRRDLEEARENIARAPSERAVRRLVADINQRIREANRSTVPGPPSTVMPLDEAQMLRTWRERRADDDQQRASTRSRGPVRARSSRDRGRGSRSRG